MRLAPLLLLLLPLVLVLVQLLLRWGLQRRTELLRSAHSYRPLRRQETPVAVEVDVDSSPLFDSPAPEGAQPHYLVFDTETQDVLHEEEVGEEEKLSPLILLSWQVLDAGGHVSRRRRTSFVVFRRSRQRLRACTGSRRSRCRLKGKIFALSLSASFR